MQGTGVLWQILTAIETALQPGAGAIRQHLLWFWQMFLWWELVTGLYRFAFRGMPLPDLAGSLLRAGIIFWAIQYWPDLMMWTQETFVALGLLAGGNSLSVQQMLDPGYVLSLGIDVGNLLYQAMLRNLGLTSIPLGFAYFILYLIYQTAFLVLAGSIFAWEIEFLVVGLMSLVLLPCLATRSLSFAASGCLSYIINAGFKFGLAAFLASVAFPALRQLTITEPVSVQSVLVTCGAAWSIAFLFFHVNRLASTILSGQPSMNFGTLLSSIIATGTAGVALATGGAAVVGGGAAAAVGATRAGVMAGAGARAGISSLASGAGPRAAIGAARSAAGAVGGTPLMTRMGSFAGSAQRLASTQGTRSLRAFADTARYVGGSDATHYGVRR